MASPSLATPTPATDAAKLARWERLAQPFIILAAIVPLLGTVGAGPPTLRSWGVELVCWAVFAFDLVVHLRLRRRYLRTREGIVDVLIVVFTFPWSILIGNQRAALTTILRFARLGRIAAVLHSSRGGRRVISRLGQPFLYVAAAVMTTSLIVFRVEKDTDGFESYGDALWWGIVTVTTVGYGDLVPQTTTGQVTAGVLMLVGVALLGTVAATLASAFHLADTRPDRGPEGADPGVVDAEVKNPAVANLVASPTAPELAALRADLADLTTMVRRALPAPSDGADENQ